MIKIYHNPKCSKSRCAFDALKASEKQYEVVDYMKNPLTGSELKTIIAKLGVEPIALVRVKEAVWKEKFKDKILTDEQIIQAMLEYPQLIERPILIDEDKAVIARSPEKIAEILN